MSAKLRAELAKRGAIVKIREVLIDNVKFPAAAQAIGALQASKRK
jgi:hypothetical protein